jgi:hypothetical protein
METLFQIYNLFKKDKKKERFDIILEPLQAVTQLALLSFCPKGSKLTIANNLLNIQTPTWTQGMVRLYNHDGRDDLFFLFNAIVRFNRFYKYLSEENSDYTDLFDLLVHLGKKGIDKLLQTYANTEQPALLHTLQLYRSLLDKPGMFTENEETNVNKLHIGTGVSAGNIDDVFIKIRSLYNSHELMILYQTLIMLEKNPDQYATYILGLNTLLSPTYDKIQKWIIENIVY